MIVYKLKQTLRAERWFFNSSYSLTITFCHERCFKSFHPSIYLAFNLKNSFLRNNFVAKHKINQVLDLLCSHILHFHIDCLFHFLYIRFQKGISIWHRICILYLQCCHHADFLLYPSKSTKDSALLVSLKLLIFCIKWNCIVKEPLFSLSIRSSFGISKTWINPCFAAFRHVWDFLFKELRILQLELSLVSSSFSYRKTHRLNALE